MTTGFPGRAVIGYLEAVLGTASARFAEARRSKDAGASAIELAIITAVVVGLAATVLIIVYNIVTSRANQIQSNNSQIP